MPITKLCKQIFGYRHGPDWVVFCSAQPQLCGAGRAGTTILVQPGGKAGPGPECLMAHIHNEHAEKHEWKGIFDKKNQGDSTFYDQTVIHTQAVYVQKAQFYEVC